MYAVTGASGQFGRIALEMLVEELGADRVVALARSPDKLEDLGLGVDVRPFDYNDPDQVLAGLDGVETLLLVSSSEVGLREVQHRNVIMGAMQQEVKRIVYTSLLRAEDSPLTLAREHVATEMMLRDSGIPFTILRNGWYLENYIGTVMSALEAGALYGAAGAGRISAASRADYARAATVVMTGEGHEGQVYELSGDASFSLGDLAGTISDIAGREIPYRDMPEADYAEALSESGLAEPWPAFLARIDAQIAGGALEDEGSTLSELIGCPTASLHEVLSASLAPAA